MCSNTSLTSGAGGYDGGGSRSGAYNTENIYPKKPKRQRFPRRGPGVAELEKILREEQRNDKLDRTKNEGLPLASPLSTSYLHQPKYLTPPPRTRVVAGNGSSDNTLSTAWNSCESCVRSSPSNQSQFPVNFPDLFNQISFPSPVLLQGSQSHCLSAPSTMRGAKRSRRSLMEILLPPSPFHRPIPNCSSHINPSTSSSINTYTRITSQFNRTSSRASKTDACLEPYYYKAGDVNSLPSVPEMMLTNASHQHDVSNFSHSPSQSQLKENIEVSSHRQQGHRLIYWEPFHGILLSPEQIDMTNTNLKNGKAEMMRGEGIDLNLKL